MGRPASSNQLAEELARLIDQVVESRVEEILADSGVLLKPLLRMSEVMETLKLSKSKIEELISEGELRPIRFGRSRRFHPKEVSDYISRNS